jgi:hypothetical protein
LSSSLVKSCSDKYDDKVYKVKRIVRVIRRAPLLVEVQWEGFNNRNENSILDRSAFVCKKELRKMLADYEANVVRRRNRTGCWRNVGPN